MSSDRRSASTGIFAPHFAGGRFFCPWGVPRRDALDLLRWQLRRRPSRERRPRAPIPRVENDGGELLTVAETPRLTWIGHASFAFHEGEQVALLDPHFGPRALGPARWSEPGLPIARLPRRAVALLSHNHYDHLDRWTLARLPKSIEWLAPLGLGGTLRSAGFSRVRELDWGESAQLGGWRASFLPAQHWSRRLSQPENSTLWGSWLLDTGRTRLLFVGDSGYFHGFGELGRLLAPLDAVILPIGAYLPRWFMQPAHMTPGEALRALRDLGARRLVPSHWGTFDLADDALDEPPRVLRELLGGPDGGAFAKRVSIPAVGETIPL